MSTTQPIDIQPGVLVDGSHERTDMFDLRVCEFVDELIGTAFAAELPGVDDWSEVADEAIGALDDKLPENIWLHLDEQCLYALAGSDEESEEI